MTGCTLHTRKENVTDRALRYRAHQCPPAGPRRCELCGSTRFLTIDHRNGFEEDTAPANLRWLCKSCNTRLGADMARKGQGRRTKQYNAGARNLMEYAAAVADHRRGAFDEGGRIIHETPASKRSEFAREIWRRRHERYGRGQENPTGPRAETYSYTVRGKHVRKATRVVFPDGYQIEFLDLMPKALAVKQAVEQRAKEQRANPPRQFAFTADKNGRPVAYEWRRRAMRWVRVNWDEAKVAISTGAGIETKKNPADDESAAAEAFEAFHGYPSTEDILIDSVEEIPSEFAALGELVKLTVRPIGRRGRVELGEFNAAVLATNGARDQLYILGGDQSVDPGEFGVTPAELHRVEVLGQVSKIVYHTNKTHLGDQGGDADYHHDFGEENGGLPFLLYDTENETLHFAGGAYTIAPEGVRD